MSEDICVICRDLLENDMPVSIIRSCGHMFHKECLEMNMKSEGSNEDTQHICPLCRKEFDATNVFDLKQEKIKPVIPDDVIRDYINDLREVFDVDCDADLEELKKQYGDRYDIDDELLKSKCIEILNQAGGKKKSNKSRKIKTKKNKKTANKKKTLTKKKHTRSRKFRRNSLKHH